MVVKSPGVDARPLPAWGLYVRNVKRLDLDGVRLGVAKADARPVMIAEDVRELNVDDFRVPVDAVAPVLRGGGTVRSTRTEWSKPENAHESR